jgi:hypothetical protein
MEVHEDSNSTSATIPMLAGNEAEHGIVALVNISVAWMNRPNFP